MKTLIGRIVASGAMPTTPAPFAVAPMMPATWVPCPARVARVRRVRDRVEAGCDAAAEIRVTGLDAGVDDADRDPGAGRSRPRLLRVDVGVHAAVRARVEHPPELGPERVGRERPDRVVGLGVDDVGIAAQLRERLRARALGDRDDLRVRQAQRALELRVGVRADVGALRGVQPGPVADDDPRVVRAGDRGGEREGEQGEREGTGQAHPDPVRQPDTRSPSRPSGSWPRVLPQRS